MAGPIPTSVVTLLSQAKTTWAEAVLEHRPAEKYRSAHLAALRAAASVLALRARPAVSVRRRPTSAWVLLDRIAPELSELCAYFADSARHRVGQQQADRPVRLEHQGELAQRQRPIRDVLQQAVRQHQVIAAGREQFGQRLDLALDGPHPVGHPGLGGPAEQGGQRIDADVHHGHLGAGGGQRNGQAARATTAVQHRRRSRVGRPLPGRRQPGPQQRRDARRHRQLTGMSRLIGSAVRLGAHTR